MANFGTAHRFQNDSGHTLRLLRPGTTAGTLKDSAAGTAPAPITAHGTITLGGNKVLSRLPISILRKLRPHFREVTVVKDDYLFQQDEDIEFVYFPESAVISEFQILEDGRTIEVAIIGNEGVVGVPSAFNSCRAINCSQVCIGGTVLRINTKRLERELTAEDSLRLALHETLVRQMKQLSQKVICNTFHSVEQRLCTWLLMLNDRGGSNSLRVTHEHVARVLGVHRPSITCIAQGLRDRGLIDYSRGRITIRNRAGIEKDACICYSESRELVH